MNIQLAESREEIEECFPVMVQLRTTLSKEEFIEKVIHQQKDGYKLAFLKDPSAGSGQEIVAVAGFRLMENLAFGKVLYVDDLIADSENRSKGYGDKLFDWLVEYAKKENCKSFQLDSGVQRFDAHRFYLKKRMHINCHHFTLSLAGE